MLDKQCPADVGLEEAQVREMQQEFPFDWVVKCYDVIFERVRLTLPTPLNVRVE